MNSDYAPVLDQNAVRTRFLFATANPLLVFQKELFPTVELLGGSVGPLQLLPVTPTSNFAGSRRAAQAMTLRDFVLKRSKELEFVESPDLRQDAEAVSRWLADCASRPVPLAAIVHVFQSMVADLTPADLDEVWWALASSGCPRRFSPQDRDWVALLQAVGRRDGARMAASSRRLLEAEPGLSVSSQRYLVAAGMLGSIAQQDSAAARDLWSRYAPNLGRAEDLLLRFLVARSGFAPPAN